MASYVHMKNVTVHSSILKPTEAHHTMIQCSSLHVPHKMAVVLHIHYTKVGATHLNSFPSLACIMPLQIISLTCSSYYSTLQSQSSPHAQLPSFYDDQAGFHRAEDETWEVLPLPLPRILAWSINIYSARMT